MVKSQSHWECKCKKLFFLAHIAVKSLVDLRQTKTKISTAHST